MTARLASGLSSALRARLRLRRTRADARAACGLRPRRACARPARASALRARPMGALAAWLGRHLGCGLGLGLAVAPRVVLRHGPRRRSCERSRGHCASPLDGPWAGRPVAASGRATSRHQGPAWGLVRRSHGFRVGALPVARLGLRKGARQCCPGCMAQRWPESPRGPRTKDPAQPDTKAARKGGHTASCHQDAANPGAPGGRGSAAGRPQRPGAPPELATEAAARAVGGTLRPTTHDGFGNGAVLEVGRSAAGRSAGIGRAR